MIAKITNHNRIPAIIVECTREELVKYLIHDYSDGTWYKLDDIIIQNSFAKTTHNPRKVKQKKKQINKGLVPKITINDKGLLLDGYITYLILKEKGVRDVLVEIVEGAKVKSYRLKSYNMSQEVKVLNITDETEFETSINSYLKEGWKILSTSCGFVDSEAYDFCTSFQAILTRSIYDKVSYEIFKDEESRAKYL